MCVESVASARDCLKRCSSSTRNLIGVCGFFMMEARTMESLALESTSLSCSRNTDPLSSSPTDPPASFLSMDRITSQCSCMPSHIILSAVSSKPASSILNFSSFVGASSEPASVPSPRLSSAQNVYIVSSQQRTERLHLELLQREEPDQGVSDDDYGDGGVSSTIPSPH